MTRAQWMSAKNNNARIVSQLLKRQPTDLTNIRFWEDNLTGRDVSMPELYSKWADIIGCAAIGAVPSIEPNGPDGYIYYYKNGRDLVYPRPIESKISGIFQDELAIGQRGGLYYSTNLENKKSKSAITSHFEGSFHSNMTLETRLSKGIDTYILPFDKTENKVIDIFQIDGEVVESLLEDRKNNKTITLKLSSFQHNGNQFGCQWPVEGYDNWEARMLKSVDRRIATY